jgi:putative ABC transport system substrate-binding protein
MIDRRAFVAGAVSVLATPLGAEAQQAQKVQQIGVVWGTFPDRSQILFEPFHAGLRELGYAEGRNILLQQRWGEGRPERIPEIMDSLVRLNVDVIVVPINPIIADATRATTTIPIVMLYAVDPVGAGFVASLAKPGGNVTGLTMGQGPETFAKNVQLLKEANHHISSVVLLFNPDAPNIDGYLRAIDDVARPLGVMLQRQSLRAIGEIEKALGAIRVDGRTALLVFPDASTYAGRAQIAQWALKTRVPATASFPDFAQSGGLMAYGANLLELSRRAAYYVHRILEGAKPGDLPVEQPTRFGLVINLKTAKTLGLTIPPAVLARADEVIQ